MDRFFADEFKDEIETAYRALLSTKKKELEILEIENAAKREEIAKLFVDYQLAIYNNDKNLSEKIDEEHTLKWKEYTRYEDEYFNKKNKLEKIIQLISLKYPDKTDN